MATYDWSLPTTTTNYSTFVTELHNRLDQVAKGFLSTDTHNNLVAGAISFRNNKWQTWSGSAWSDLAATYAISISGSASSVTSTVTVDKGGTNISSYTIGDLLYASGATALSKLAGVATGNVLLSGGIATAPSWGKIDLSTHTNSTMLPVTKGGLGTSAITGLVKGTGTAYEAAIAGTDYATASHTHNYLSTSGGTIVGNLTLSTGVLAIGHSGGVGSGAYLYDNGTSFGLAKTSGVAFTINVSNGNLSTNGNISASTTIAAGTAITAGTTITAGTGLTVTTGNLVVSSGSLSTSSSITAGAGLTVTTGNLAVSSGDITASGSITASGNITAYSDQRLKTDISTLKNALTKVSQLRGVSYTKAGTPEIGVIAQEVELVVPEVVYDGEYKSVAYGNLVALLIEAIKELNEKLDARTSN